MITFQDNRRIQLLCLSHFFLSVKCTSVDEIFELIDNTRQKLERPKLLKTEENKEKTEQKINKHNKIKDGKPKTIDFLSSPSKYQNPVHR